MFGSLRQLVTFLCLSYAPLLLFLSVAIISSLFHSRGLWSLICSVKIGSLLCRSRITWLLFGRENNKQVVLFEGAWWNVFGSSYFISGWSYPIFLVVIAWVAYARSYDLISIFSLDPSFHQVHCMSALDETCLGWVILFEGGLIKFAKLWPLGCLVLVRVANFLLSPLCLHSVGLAMSRCMRTPDEMRSGRVILFEGSRIKFSKLWSLGCLVHVHAACFLFSPLCLLSFRNALLHRVRAPDETNLCQVISFEANHINFSKLWLPLCLVHVHVAHFPFSPFCLHSVEHVMSRCVRAHNEMRSG